jgi:hypothetical protein
MQNSESEEIFAIALPPVFIETTCRETPSTTQKEMFEILVVMLRTEGYDALKRIGAEHTMALIPDTSARLDHQPSGHGVESYAYQITDNQGDGTTPSYAGAHLDSRLLEDTKYKICKHWVVEMLIVGLRNSLVDTQRRYAKINALIVRKRKKKIGEKKATKIKELHPYRTLIAKQTGNSIESPGFIYTIERSEPNTEEKKSKTGKPHKKRTIEEEKAQKICLAAAKTSLKVVRAVALARTACKVVAEQAGKQVAKKVAAKGASSLLKKVPLAGVGVGVAMAGCRIADGQYFQAGLEVASGCVSCIPVVGTVASIGIDGINLLIDLW